MGKVSSHRAAKAGGAPASGRSVRVRWYGSRPSLTEDMERADVILCHAGAGTLLEALDVSGRRRGGPGVICAVVNSELMNDHQSELADELERRGHVLVVRSCRRELASDEGAARFWRAAGEFAPVPSRSAAGTRAASSG